MRFFAKFIRGKIFAGLFALFSFGSIFYVSDRMGKFFLSICGHSFRWAISGILVILMGYMLLYIRSKKKVKGTRRIYETCSVAMCFLLYLLLLLWVYDLWNLIFRINYDRYYSIPIIGSVVLTFYGFLHAKKLYLKEYDIPLKHLKGTKRVVLLSDIHVGTFVNIGQLKKIVAKVNQMKPDMVIIAGDLFDVEAFVYCNKKVIAQVLRQLKLEEGIFAVLGNHDPKSSEKEIRDFYKDAQIKLLVDDRAETEDFVLVGRDDVTTNPARMQLRDILKDTESERSSENAKSRIVADHNPLGIKEAAENKVGLVLCGHTHKGQFFPANVFTKLAYGKQGYYGHYQDGCTQSVVSSGAGYFQMPMRIGSNSEIVVLNMKEK